MLLVPVDSTRKTWGHVGQGKLLNTIPGGPHRDVPPALGGGTFQPLYLPVFEGTDSHKCSTGMPPGLVAEVYMAP